MAKRSIDRKREAAGQMEIGTPDHQSAVTAVFPIGDDLYVVKERGVYEVKLAARRMQSAQETVRVVPTFSRVVRFRPHYGSLTRS